MLHHSSRLTLLAVGSLLAGCGTAEPPVTPTNASLFASAIGFTEGSYDYWACTLEGAYPFPGWHRASHTDLVALHFTRGYLFADGHVIVKDTLYPSVAVTLTYLSPAQIQTTLGPPFNQTRVASFNSDGMGSVLGEWLCSTDLAFATDSALVGAGYHADSLYSGAIQISRVLAD